MTDSDNNRVQIFTSTGGYFSQWGSEGVSNGQFRKPWGIVEDSSGKVYVSDYLGLRVQHFQADGTFFIQWIINLYPSGIAVDSSDNVYITDNYNNQVQKFDSTGVYISEWGSPSGVSDGKLSAPMGLIISSDEVYVADMNNSRIQKFDTSGTFIEKWGTVGVDDGEYSNLQGVVIV